MESKVYFICLFLSTIAVCYLSELEQCDAIKAYVFKHCTRRYKLKNSVLLKGRNSSNDNSLRCPNKICQDKLVFTQIARKLYGFKVLGHVVTMLETCCRNCFSYKVANRVSISQINQTIKDTSDFILPVFTKLSEIRKFGFYYIPVFEAPSAYYLTVKISSYEKCIQFLVGIFSTWPLVVICLTLTFISGFVIWLMEKRRNTEEFPIPFLKGLWEGGWWAFVTMTTVGYGDKVPRSFASRLFTIIWVLTGMTLFAVLTGSLTNQITAIFSNPVQTLSGKRVGGLANKINVATMVAQHGGFLVEHQYNNTVHGYANMITSLVQKKIDGFVMSRPNFYFASKIKHYRRYQKIWEKQKEIEMDRTEIHYVGIELSIGVLVKKYAHFHYFKSYFEDNWLQLQSCNTFNVNANNLKYAPKKYQMDGVSDAFMLFIYVVAAFIFVIFCFGLVYEWRRYRERKKKDSNECQAEDEESKMMKSSKEM